MTLLLTLALVLGYYVGASDREVIQSSPIPKPQRRHGPFGVTVIKTRLALQVNRPLSSRPFISLPIVPEILSTSNPLLLKAARLIKQLPAGTLVEVAGYTYNIGSPTILDAEFVQDIVTCLLHDLGAGVIVFVDAVAKSHQPERIVLVLGTGDELRDILDRADFHQHFERGFASTAMRVAP
jgi:hypothetical protein